MRYHCVNGLHIKRANAEWKNKVDELKAILQFIMTFEFSTHREQRLQSRYKTSVEQKLIMIYQARHLSKIFRFYFQSANLMYFFSPPKQSLINLTRQSARLIKANPSELLVAGAHAKRAIH